MIYALLRGEKLSQKLDRRRKNDKYQAPGDNDQDDGDHSPIGEHETNFVDPFKLEATLCLCQVTGLSEISYFLRNQRHQILQAL